MHAAHYPSVDLILQDEAPNPAPPRRGQCRALEVPLVPGGAAALKDKPRIGTAPRNRLRPRVASTDSAVSSGRRRN